MEKKVTNDEYRAKEGVSRSQLSILLSQTPLHFKYAEENKGKEDTPALVFGRAAHKYILEKESFFDEFAVAPQCDRRTKDGKEIYANFLIQSEGKSVISSDDYKAIEEMSKAIDETPLARPLLTGECEQSFFWTDAETGEICKIRPDCITEYAGKKYLVDYKTTDSCADGHFERSVRKFGYKFQSGMYREGFFQNTFDDVGFVFVAQEKKPPYAARVYFCSDEFINEGCEQFRKAISIYHYCKETGNWYGYSGPDNTLTYLYEEGEQ